MNEALPSLILEQMAENLVRVPRAKEQYDRESYELRRVRLSLFLQLSKEVKTRDSILLTNYTESRLRSKLKAQDKKIRSIQKQIDDNLLEERKIREKYAPRIEADKEREKRIEEGRVVDPENDGNSFARMLRGFIPGRNEDERTIEKVAFYQNDITRLFDPGESVSKEGYSSFAFSKACVDAKINGLMTGVVTVYGAYLSVAVTLYQFPGAVRIASAMEVGDMDDLKLISVGLARQLTPRIADSMPIEISFEIEPPEASSSVQITVDDVVFKNLSSALTMQSGVHTLMFSAPEFNDVATSYSFIGNRRFHVKVVMTRTKNGSAALAFSRPAAGDVFVNGVLSGSVQDDSSFSQIFIDGKAVLGHFIAENGETADFMILQKDMVDGANLAVSLKAFDRSDYIEARRKWMYRSYSLLIVSLIPTFYCYGNSYASARGYNYDYGVPLDDARSWQTASYVTIGISGVCGAWFVYELVRYLNSANTVLPATAKPVSERKMTKIRARDEKRAAKRAAEEASKQAELSEQSVDEADELYTDTNDDSEQEK